MNELTVFNNDEFGAIHTLTIGNEPWFVGKDVAIALGYTNPQKAVRDHVGDEDKGVNETFTPGGKQNITIINESGLYSLIMSSKLPSAKKFKHWVTSEVLPTIRKHGAYMTPETLQQAILNPDTMIQLCQQLKDEQDKRKKLEQKVSEDKPKVLFADSVATSNSTILIGELAKILRQNGVNIGQNRLFDWMRNNGYLICRKGADYNMPTQRSMELGLFKIKETAITHSDGTTSVTKTVKVTGKGQQYFINKFLTGNTPNCTTVTV